MPPLELEELVRGPMLDPALVTGWRAGFERAAWT